ncbi:MAG: asparagine synthase C-terminal domain-containing protein [Nanobdellota archaeon]
MTLPTTDDGWNDYISTIKRHCELDTSRNHESTVKILASLVEAIITRMADEALEQGSLGLLFSGGIDSTLIGYILKKNNKPFTAVSIGFRDSPEQKLPDDIRASREIAETLGFDYIERIYDFKDIEELFNESASILGPELVNTVNIGVGSVEAAGIKTLKEYNPGITHVFGGLGSEEIFAGYKRHSDADNVHEECWNGLIKMFKRDLLREFSLARHFNISLLTPFLDKEVIREAMTIPDSMKLTESGSKLIIRDAAEFMGLDMQFSKRPKKAAQYGSRTHHALSKLSKKNGFEYIKDYLKTL